MNNFKGNLQNIVLYIIDLKEKSEREGEYDESVSMMTSVSCGPVQSFFQICGYSQETENKIIRFSL